LESSISLAHWVDRGKGIPKEREGKFRRREVPREGRFRVIKKRYILRCPYCVFTTTNEVERGRSGEGVDSVMLHWCQTL
jgi:hypothetical protein